MNFKKILLFISIFIISLIVSGCTISNNQKQEDSSQKIKIGSSIYPIYSLVKVVGGEKINPILILPAGSSPHTFEISPQEVKEMQAAQLLFMVGGEVDAWARNIKSVVPDLILIQLNDFIELKPFNLQTDYDKEDSLDPHTWLDPNNAEIMLNKIAFELGRIDEANKDYYQNNAQQYLEKITSTDRDWQAKISSLRNKNLVVFHDAWGYFARHFGLEIAATFEPFPGKTPSPKDIALYQEAVRKYDVGTIFVEPQMSQESVDILAQDIGVNISVLDPLGGLQGREDYISLIEYNINNIFQSMR